MNSSEKVRRGFNRISALGFWFLVFADLVFCVWVTLYPNGSVVINNTDVTYIGGFPVFKLSGSKFAESALNRLEGIEAKSLILEDGREVNYVSSDPTRSTEQTEIEQLGQSIKVYERKSEAPIDSYSTPYFAGNLLFKCKNNFSCGYPPPLPQNSIFHRRSDYTLGGFLFGAALIWVTFFGLVSWLIRGLMED